MRIAFITFEYPPFIIGGAGIYALNVTRELAKLGHQVIVFTPDILEDKSGLDLYNLEIQKISINNKLPFKAVQFWLRLPTEIEKLEKKYRFDIIHFNGISYWFLKNRLSKAKHVVTIHHSVKDAIKNNNLSFFSRMKDISGENSFFVSSLEKKCIKSSDKLIAVSNFTKRQIINSYNIDPSRIKVIYNGTYSKDYSYARDEILRIKSKFNLGEHPIILFVGRVNDPRKGLDFLLRAIKRVLENTEVTLLIVGKGDQSEARKLIDYLGISNNVIFSGFADDNFLKACYSLCTIYVCSSKLEGFGLTLIEAMSAGKPVIATNVGAIPEIIVNGVNGALVESGDIDGMCKAICILLKDQKLADNIGRKNAQYIVGKFSWGANAQQLLDIYNDLLVSA